jgi:hypothetical protein
MVADHFEVGHLFPLKDCKPKCARSVVVVEEKAKRNAQYSGIFISAHHVQQSRNDPATTQRISRDTTGQTPLYLVLPGVRWNQFLSYWMGFGRASRPRTGTLLIENQGS